MKILIVEDDPIVAEALAHQLYELNYLNIVFAKNANEVFDKIKKDSPSIIFMDIGLKESKWDGIQIAEKVSEKHLIPIIFLSAYSDESTLSRTKKIPFANYLVKPPSSRQLFVSINNALDFSKKLIKEFDTTISECPIYSKENHFYIKSKSNTYIKVMINQILWIEAVRGGIQFNLIDQKSEILTATFASFSRQFQNSNLIRVHRSFMINKSKVYAIQDKNLIIGDSNFNRLIPVGSNYKNIFQSHFKTLKSD